MTGDAQHQVESGVVSGEKGIERVVRGLSSGDLVRFNDRAHPLKVVESEVGSPTANLVGVKYGEYEMTVDPDIPRVYSYHDSGGVGKIPVDSVEVVGIDDVKTMRAKCVLASL